MHTHVLDSSAYTPQSFIGCVERLTSIRSCRFLNRISQQTGPHMNERAMLIKRYKSLSWNDYQDSWKNTYPYFTFSFYVRFSWLQGQTYTQRMNCVFLCVRSVLFQDRSNPVLGVLRSYVRPLFTLLLCGDCSCKRWVQL